MVCRLHSGLGGHVDRRFNVSITVLGIVSIRDNIRPPRLSSCHTACFGSGSEKEIAVPNHDTFGKSVKSLVFQDSTIRMLLYAREAFGVRSSMKAALTSEKPSDTLTKAIG